MKSNKSYLLKASMFFLACLSTPGYSNTTYTFTLPVSDAGLMSHWETASGAGWITTDGCLTNCAVTDVLDWSFTLQTVVLPVPGNVYTPFVYVFDPAHATLHSGVALSIKNLDFSGNLPFDIWIWADQPGSGGSLRLERNSSNALQWSTNSVGGIDFECTSPCPSLAIASTSTLVPLPASFILLASGMAALRLFKRS